VFRSLGERLRQDRVGKPERQNLPLGMMVGTAPAHKAVRLKWPLPLPLIAGSLLHPSLRISSVSSLDEGGGHQRRRRPYPGDPDWANSCALAYAHAAIHACDLFATLERNVQKLAAVAPRLRAKGAAAVIERLHNEDAVFPSKARAGTTGARGGAARSGTMSVGDGVAMSSRSMRRLFDRLVALGAVRELTGRPTFRLYGL
jgi:hypothetical protein